MGERRLPSFAIVGRAFFPPRQSPRVASSRLHDVLPDELSALPVGAGLPPGAIGPTFGPILIFHQTPIGRPTDGWKMSPDFRKNPKKSKNLPVGTAVPVDRPDCPKNPSVTTQTTPCDLSSFYLIFSPQAPK